MNQFNTLPLGRKLVLGAGLLLLIDTFFAWQKIEVKVAGIVDVTAKANAWHGFWGFVMGLATIALVVWVGAKALGTKLPFELPDGLTTLGLAAAILVCALLKNLVDDYSAWASYVGVVLAAAITYGAWLVFQESGEKLPEFASGDANT